MTDKASIPYLVYAPRLTGNSAGLRVLIRITQLLSEAGLDASLIIPKHRTAGTKLLQRFHGLKVADLGHLLTLDKAERNPIVVYPESIAGNPLNSANIARLVLNIPGMFGGDQRYGAHEMVFGYEDALTRMVDGLGTLKIEVVDRALFIPPPPGTPRTKTCFYAGKYRKLGGTTTGLPEGCIEILHEGPQAQSPKEIAALLQQSLALYTFEPTLLTTEAGLCGCPNVFVPNEHFIGSFGHHPYGEERTQAVLNDPGIFDATAQEFAQRLDAANAQMRAQLAFFIETTQTRARERQQKNHLNFIVPKPSGRIKLREIFWFLLELKRTCPERFTYVALRQLKKLRRRKNSLQYEYT